MLRSAWHTVGPQTAHPSPISHSSSFALLPCPFLTERAVTLALVVLMNCGVGPAVAHQHLPCARCAPLGPACSSGLISLPVPPLPAPIALASSPAPSHLLAFAHAGLPAERSVTLDPPSPGLEKACLPVRSQLPQGHPTQIWSGSSNRMGCPKQWPEGIWLASWGWDESFSPVTALLDTQCGMNE